MKCFICFLCLILLGLVLFAQPQHPLTFLKNKEALELRKNISLYPLLNASYQDIKNEVDAYIGKDVDVPFPKDAAGGYTHDKHKSNYTLMFNSGLLYNITGEAKYATLVKNMLFKYAKLNPTLGKHPQATSATPGHLFWQSLNDANWMVYAGMAYDLIYESCLPKEKKIIEDGAFKPEVDYFIKEMPDWFDLLHNHAVWACAGVGMIGIATNNQDYIDLALYGSKKDKKSGFIAQMDHLFSADGYYTEGPYYLRYAILPYMLFATALQHKDPSLKIFAHRDSILHKALITCLQQTNTNGVFFPINDAIKDKDYTSNELVTAISISSAEYGIEDGLLTIAKKQNRVMLNSGGASIAKEIAARNDISPYFPYKTIESVDGDSGTTAGVSILRNGKNENLTSLIYKYTTHGMSHGHFDKLNINLFDNGNEILTDYGSARFIGIEQKWGGRYLPENVAYAAQTIAHNTLVADETSHFKGDGEVGEKYHSEKLFSDVSNPEIQVVAAKEVNAYKDIRMQRNEYMLELPSGKKLLIDVFHAFSANKHQYDLPFQFNGQFIKSSFPYQPNTQKLETLGNANGYQFLWKEASAKVKDTLAQFTFLNGKSYYTISSLIQDSASLYFTRSGANDPNFNLRHEPAFIIRKNGSNQTFVNVIEIHGKYDAVNEFSTDAYSSVKKINIIRNDDKMTIVEVVMAAQKIWIAQTNEDFNPDNLHYFSNDTLKFQWKGPYQVNVHKE
jgi:hypothetical protein